MKSGSLGDLRPRRIRHRARRRAGARAGVQLGDKVTLIAPQGQVTPAGMMPRLKQFRVVGIFEIGMFEYDSSLALIDHRAMRRSCTAWATRFPACA